MALLQFHDRWTEYSDEIISVLKETSSNRLLLRFTSPQIQYRDVIVNFIRSVGEYHRFRRSTVHLAVYLLDAFMDNHDITDNRLFLVALSCIHLSAKIEENEPNVPSLTKLNELARNQFPTSDFTVLEVLLLRFFDWHLIIPTAATFVECWLLQIVEQMDFPFSLSEKQFSEKRDRAIELALEFLDITLMDVKINNIHPSLVASACLAAARSSLPTLCFWSRNMETLTSYKSKDIDYVTRKLMNLRASLIANEIACKKRRIFNIEDINEDSRYNEKRLKPDYGYVSRNGGYGTDEFEEGTYGKFGQLECIKEETDEEIVLTFVSR